MSQIEGRQVDVWLLFHGMLLPVFVQDSMQHSFIFRYSFSPCALLEFSGWIHRIVPTHLGKNRSCYDWYIVVDTDHISNKYCFFRVSLTYHWEIIFILYIPETIHSNFSVVTVDQLQKTYEHTGMFSVIFHIFSLLSQRSTYLW